MSERRILVVGATGQQGGAVAEQLLSWDGEPTFSVDALTRNPAGDAARRLADVGATVVEGDLLDPGSLEPLVAAVDAVFSVSVFRAGGPEVERRQGMNVAEVAADVGVEHLVYSSVASADRDTGLANFEPKRAIEERIAELGIPATVLRPTYFMQNFEGQRAAILEGTLALPLEPDVSLQLVDVDDIGAMAVRAFADPTRYVGGTYELAGDEHTLASAAAVFSDVTGVDVRPESLPVEAAGEQVDEVHAAMHRWFNEHGYEVDIAALRREHDVAFTDLESYLRRHGWDRGE